MGAFYRSEVGMPTGISTPHPSTSPHRPQLLLLLHMFCLRLLRPACSAVDKIRSNRLLPIPRIAVPKMQAVKNMVSSASGPQYLTGNKPGLDAFIDQFDVGDPLSLSLLNMNKSRNLTALHRSSSSTAMVQPLSPANLPPPLRH